jgi:hypothetical protein
VPAFLSAARVGSTQPLVASSSRPRAIAAGFTVRRRSARSFEVHGVERGDSQGGVAATPSGLSDDPDEAIEIKTSSLLQCTWFGHGTNPMCQSIAVTSAPE